MKISRATVNFALDTTLLILLLVTVWTSSIVRVVFPPAAESRGYLLWGLPYDQWSEISFASLGALTLAILLHLVMHWDWVFGYITTRIGRIRGRSAVVNDGIKTLYGVGFLISVVTVLGGLLFYAAMVLKSPN